MLKKKKSKYDEAPPEDVFNEIKEKCIEYWKENFNDENGYVTAKINRINKIKNVDNDFLFMVNMFDTQNEKFCIQGMNPKARAWIRATKISLGYN